MNFSTVTAPVHIINYAKTINKGCDNNPMMILQEECAELIQALSKVMRACTPDDPRFHKAQENLCEEVAHVLISIDTLAELCPKLIDFEQVKSYVKVKETALQNMLGEEYDYDIAVAGVGVGE